VTRGLLDQRRGRDGTQRRHHRLGSTIKEEKIEGNDSPLFSKVRKQLQRRYLFYLLFFSFFFPSWTERGRGGGSTSGLGKKKGKGEIATILRME
jgi:hypothetical protein